MKPQPEIRIPILLFAGYKLYNKAFFNQFPYIFAYSIGGKVVNITLSSVITKYLFLWWFELDVTYSQMVTFVCVSNIVEPLSIFSFLKKTSMNNFYLLLGCFIIRNAVAVDVFSASIRLAHLQKSVEVPLQTYILLTIKPVYDATIGIMSGVLVGLLTALSVKRRGRIVGDFGEIGTIVSSTCFVYFATSILRVSSLFGVLAICIVQERYLFMNMKEHNVIAVKNTLEGVSYCLQLLFYIFVGYKLLSVDFSGVYQYCLTALAASYLAKILIIGVVSLVINVWKTSPIKTQMQGLLVFGGTKGARSYPLIVSYIGPFSRTFQDMVLLIIVFSVLFDNFISHMLVSRLNKRLGLLQEEEDREIHMVPAPVEKTTNSCFEWLRKKELKFHQYFKCQE